MGRQSKMTWKDITVIVGLIVFTVGGVLGAEQRYAPASIVATVRANDLQSQLRSLQFQWRVEKCKTEDRRTFCQWLKQEMDRIKLQMQGR